MKRDPCLIASFLLVLNALTPVSSARADWPPTGLLVRDTGGSPTSLVGDGAGGVLMNWGVSAVQRITAGGELLIPPGSPLLPGASVALPGFSDGSGGMYIAALQNTEIVLLRVGPTGAVIWNAPVCQTPYTKQDLHASSDGLGGALIAWSEARPLPSPQDGLSAYCQRINSFGSAMWTQDGLRVRYYALTPPRGPSYATPVWVDAVTFTGTGGAHVFFHDDEDLIVYRMRSVSPDGALGFVSNGSFDPWGPIVPDNFGGSYAAGFPQPNHKLQLALRLRDASGVLQWEKPINVVPDFYPWYSIAIHAVNDGALVAWIDQRSDGIRKLYVQKVDRSGSALWTLNGVQIAATVSEFDVGADFHGGAIVVWADYHAGGISDVYMQRLSAAGAPMLPGLGMPVSPVPAQRVSPKLHSDPAGHAIVMWKSGETPESFAYRVDVTTLAVAISDFNARVRGDDVVLGATLRSDLGVDFVKVYRAVGNATFVLHETLGSPRDDHFEYVDDDVAPATTYRYQLAVGDADGEFMSPIVAVSTPALTFALEQNHPNPFNPTTTIRFSISTHDRVTLAVFGADGGLVRTLVDETRAPGSHEAKWDGRDGLGRPVSSGVYFYRLVASKQTATRKMVLLK